MTRFGLITQWWHWLCVCFPSSILIWCRYCKKRRRTNPALSGDTMSKEQVKRLQPRLYLLYHELRPTSSQYSYVLEPSAFQKQINLFAELRRTENPGLWPEVTFDDGHISNFEYALPILQSQNLKAAVFHHCGLDRAETRLYGVDGVADSCMKPASRSGRMGGLTLCSLTALRRT